ncbi:MAG: MBL fold metallo-hydrolase [Pseudomonadota bacterium]|nr:MBL fold metallo-hydrolase [Pseudomonadota bacterium]
MRITILGCGSSGGVPLIGCQCSVCVSDNPKNRRSRVSVLVEAEDINLLIDSSPDLRQQALRHDIRRIDAVLYTHDHADHTGGLDDLRSFNYLSNDAIPVYSNDDTIQRIQKRFAYAFLPRPDGTIWYRPCLTPHVIPDGNQHFTVSGIPVTAFEQRHAKTKTLGYRIGNFSYSTDVNVLPEEAFDALQGTEVWVVDCLRYTKSLSHSDLENTLAWIGRVRPKLAVLTHMAHEFDYDVLSKELPPGVVPGYDGMVIDL